MVTGTIHALSAGVATSIPSTADSTEIAGKAEQQNGAAAPRRQGRLREHTGGEREDAAFAVVVRAQDERDVLDRHDDDERPQHERQHTEHVGGVDRHRMVLVAEHLLDRVQRTRADVAVDDAERRERERSASRRVGFAVRCPRLGHHATNR
jgi:hypothetical protein